MKLYFGYRIHISTTMLMQNFSFIYIYKRLLFIKAITKKRQIYGSNIYIINIYI